MKKQIEPLTSFQHIVLQYMHDKNIGSIHDDEGFQWLFPCDIRDSSFLAERIFGQKLDIRKHFSCKA